MSALLTVLYDADCGVCTHTARALSRLDTRRRLRLVALQRASNPDLPPRGDLEEALHARDGDGTWFVGAAAAVEVARRIPLLWPISVVARLPLAMPVLNFAYRAVANNRQGLSRLLRLQACRVPATRA